MPEGLKITSCWSKKIDVNLINFAGGSVERGWLLQLIVVVH